MGAITLLGLLLRAHDLTGAPLFLDNEDELQFAWAGMGLILHGDAYTWSYFPAYPSHTTLHLFGQTFPMVHQWMDHPPLYSLLVGAWVVLLGARQLDQVTAVPVRIIPIVASSATVFLIAVYARPILGRWPALIAAALLATAPAAVLLGRQSE
ncbi:MAG: glycosyltransferase family 39 protein, partial [Candidatus Dormibacteraeota bacterium]|nr:glycosyltransferase family 39 protein [Candidatus Dormibacteraeota bacterium]